MRLGLKSKENGRSRTWSLMMHKHPPASTRAREVRESLAGSAGRVAEFSRRSARARSFTTPRCDILQRQLRGPSGLSAPAERIKQARELVQMASKRA